MPSPDMNHRAGQLRHDVDDVYELVHDMKVTLDGTRDVVGSVKMTQVRHQNRLNSILDSQDLFVGRLDRLEQGQDKHASTLREHGAKLDQLDNKVDQVLALLTTDK